MDWESAKTFFFRHKAAFSWAAGGTVAGVAVALVVYGVFNAISPATAAARELGLTLTVSFWSRCRLPRHAG